MAIECYDDKCPHHASYGCTNPDDCDGPVCYEEECIKAYEIEDLTKEG